MKDLDDFNYSYGFVLKTITTVKTLELYRKCD